MRIRGSHHRVDLGRLQGPVTVEPGETEQFVYVVFRAQDRDGWCEVPAGAVSLHPVLTSADAANDIGDHDPVETRRLPHRFR
ncbi:MAG: hypothetical protein U5Q44_04495 [Dehalococcoidia bacterium]|nr:hypothetical protein [Dehalococcoidia bacterium]